MATIAEEVPAQSTRVSRAGWYALALVSTAQGLSLLDRQILSILAPSIRADLHLGDSELGLLYGTLFSLFYALFSLPLGWLVDGWIRTRLTRHRRMHWTMSVASAEQASAQLRHIFAQYIRWWTASPSG